MIRRHPWEPAAAVYGMCLFSTKLGILSALGEAWGEGRMQNQGKCLTEFMGCAKSDLRV